MPQSPADQHALKQRQALILSCLLTMSFCLRILGGIRYLTKEKVITAIFLSLKVFLAAHKFKNYMLKKESLFLKERKAILRFQTDTHHGPHEPWPKLSPPEPMPILPPWITHLSCQVNSETAPRPSVLASDRACPLFLFARPKPYLSLPFLFIPLRAFSVSSPL